MTKLLPNSLTIALYIVLGAIILKLLNSLVNRALSRKLNLQTQMLIRKAIRGVGIFVISVLVLNTLDVPLSALLGTAGIVTVGSRYRFTEFDGQSYQWYLPPIRAVVRGRGCDRSRRLHRYGSIGGPSQRQDQDLRWPSSQNPQ